MTLSKEFIEDFIDIESGALELPDNLAMAIYFKFSNKEDEKYYLSLLKDDIITAVDLLQFPEDCKMICVSTTTDDKHKVLDNFLSINILNSLNIYGWITKPHPESKVQRQVRVKLT